MNRRTSIPTDETELAPFLKWPGGKRWLVKQLRTLLPEMSQFEGTYIEPFLGGAAVFFALKPAKAILNDLNTDLIRVYRAIRDDPEGIERRLRAYQNHHSKNFYYRTRQSKARSTTGAAARFLYLNRTCWNGLYRVNTKGEFNVPIGTKDSVILPTDDFERVSQRLKSVSLVSKDFSRVIENAGKGDIVFADPPYTVNHNMNGFLKYNENLFSWGDQQRLYACAREAAGRGAKVFVSNANHESIRALYGGQDFKFHEVDRHSKLAGIRNARRKISELLIESR